MGLRGDAAAAGEPGEVPHVTRQIAAEAATWVARLHGPGRTREMELRCLEWQAQSPAHRHAFERCTETWMEVPNAARAGGFTSEEVRRAASEMSRGGQGARTPRGLLQVAAVAVLALAAGTAGWQALHGATDYQTAVGEAQTVVLEDGGRMSLNTDTRVSVDFGVRQRTVTLGGGEAEFVVAPDAQRPFVVRAGGTEVVALGTVFTVRLLPAGPGAAASLAVTLVEGKVSVRAAQGAAGPVAPAQPQELGPGERLRLLKEGAAPAVAQRDRPRLEQVLAWKRSEAVFDGATLAEAVAEMNRYSRTTVVLAGDLARSDQRVIGQFRTGDNAAFARALAMLHGLAVREHEGRLELSPGS